MTNKREDIERKYNEKQMELEMRRAHMFEKCQEDYDWLCSNCEGVNEIDGIFRRKKIGDIMTDKEYIIDYILEWIDFDDYEYLDEYELEFLSDDDLEDLYNDASNKETSGMLNALGLTWSEDGDLIPEDY